MIDYETFCRLRQLFDEQGLKIPQIAAALGLDPKTVEKWVSQPTYQAREGTRRPSKLDGFKGQIAALLERHPYTAQQLFQQLRQKGYAGGYTILKEFVRQVRPVHKPAFLMLAFAPGECAQVDWGNFGSVSVGSTRRRLSFFVMVLCYSRLMYVEFTLSERMEQFLSCHRRALEFFGGVPEKVVIDYVPGNIIDLMCPTRLCGERLKTPVFPGEIGNTGAHNLCGLSVANSVRSCRKGDCHDRPLLPKTADHRPHPGFLAGRAD